MNPEKLRGPEDEISFGGEGVPQKGISDLIAEIRNEATVEAAPVATKVENPEALREEVEKIKPEVIELADILTAQRTLERGRMDYATLTGSADGYIKAKRENLELYDKAKSIVGKSGFIDVLRKSWNNRDTLLQGSVNDHDLRKILDFSWQSNIPMTNMNSNTWDRERAVSDFWKEGEPKVSSAALEEMRDRKGAMNYQFGNMLDRGAKQTVESPTDYIEAMWRDFRRNTDYPSQAIAKPETSDGQKRELEKGIRHIYDLRPDMLAAGFGIGALEAGDVRIAAEAFAFAETVRASSPEVVQTLNDKLQRLEVSDRKTFAETFESERNREREYAWVGGPEGGYELK